MPFAPAHVELLNKALESTHGIAVSTNNPPQLQAKLYKIRREFDQFKSLSITLPPNGTELWILTTSEIPNGL